MSIKYLYFLISSLFLSFLSCSDDETKSPETPFHEGEAISFGGRTGYEDNSKSSSTRTIYTGYKYYYRGSRFEKVDWVVGQDQISIFCEQASLSTGGNQHVADYKVIDHHSGILSELPDYGTFIPCEESKYLCWGDLKNAHDFYAIYPSVGQLPMTSDPNSNGIEFYKDNGHVKMKGVVPSMQVPIKISQGAESGTKEYNGYIAYPNMQTAYMTAVNKGFKPWISERSIDLTFLSVVTALEIELVAEDNDVLLQTVRITSKKHNLSGSFIADLDVPNPLYPAIELFENNQARNNITIPLDQSGTGFLLRKGEKIKLTAFMLPVEDLDDLSLTVVTSDGQKIRDLKSRWGNPIRFEAHLKHYISELNLPKKEQLDGSNWLEGLLDEIYLSQLSVPGISSAVSGKDADDAIDNLEDAIEDQWDEGYRCFEIPCFGDNTGDFEDFWKDDIWDDVVKEIWEKITEESTSEFALFIINHKPNYSSYSDGLDPDKKSEEFMRNFDRFFTYLKSKNVKTSLFQPNKTIGDVRGSIMFIVRPSSRGESSVNVNDYIGKDYLVIDGWGNLPDKWFERGYPIAEECNFAFAHTENTVEASMLAEGRTSKYAPAFENLLQSSGTIDFSYPTNGGFNVWAQEWHRVVPSDIKTYTEISRDKKYLWVHWGESYDEKLASAIDTHNRAVSTLGEAPSANSPVYVNSICGYFVDPNKYETCIPVFSHKWEKSKSIVRRYGDKPGQIGAFSDRINADFLQYVQTAPKGPMGFVLMNSEGGVSAGNALKKLIIENNFTQPLSKFQ